MSQSRQQGGAFLPHTEADVRDMLRIIGADGVDQLFDEIAPSLKTADFSALASGVDEMTMLADMAARAKLDETGPCFTGAGCYDHHIPAAVWDLAARGEFMTAYTPYQAEASQGTLQVIYEYQSMMTALTGMEVSNASVYDGGSALGEAVLMAVRARRRRKTSGKADAPRIAVAAACHPLYLRTAANIVGNQGIEFHRIPFGEDGRTQLDALAKQPLPEAIVVQQPNFLGVLEPVDELTSWAKDNGVLVIAVTNPLSLAMLKPPGEWAGVGADIVCGDGQPLGIPMASGGPSFGFICTRQQHVRQLPGRLVGRTVDGKGNSGFTLTLQAREQHIRRGKATSNICTNQGLLVTAATIHVALLGAQGLLRAAASCCANTRELVRTLGAIDGVRQRFDAPFFHECVVDVGSDAGRVVEDLAAADIVGGLPLGAFYPHLASCLLVCATEKRTGDEIAAFGAALAKVRRERGRPARGMEPSGRVDPSTEKGASKKDASAKPVARSRQGPRP